MLQRLSCSRDQGDRDLDFSVNHLCDGRPGNDTDFLSAFAIEVEHLGFTGLYFPEHVVLFDTYDSRYPYRRFVADEDSHVSEVEVGRDQGLFDPLVACAVAGMATSRLRVGTSVLVTVVRDPVVLAKEVATIDHVTGGRLDLGLGVGWLRKEIEAAGGSFDRRGARLDEYIGAMKSLWMEARSSYQGEFVNFEDAISFPKPLQDPHPPILAGGNSRAMIRRAARHCQGWYPWNMTIVEATESLRVLDEELESVGRTRRDLRVMFGVRHQCDPGDLTDYVEELDALGVDEIVFSFRIRPDDYQELLGHAATVFGLNSSKA